MHIEMKKTLLRIVPDSIEDQVFLEKILRAESEEDVVEFMRIDEADSFFLESCDY
jgi:hypothetical protein